MNYQSSKVLEENKENNVEVKNIFFKDIKFNNVDFKYDGTEKKIFNGLSLNISKGDTVGIYGPSGAGKSTLVDLICGLLDASNGEIIINDKKIKDLKKFLAKFNRVCSTSTIFL